MVARILIPSRFLTEIRYQGIKESMRNKEAAGTLFGEYYGRNDSIMIREIFVLPPVIGGNSLKSRMRDLLSVLLNFHRFVACENRSWKYEQKSRKEGRIFAEVNYHTHPLDGGSWSPADLCVLRSYANYDARHADLLYMTDTDEFSVRDTELNDVSIHQV
jgi:hypothetical protein